MDRSVPAVELLDSKEDPDFPSSVVSDGGENDRELSSDSGCLSDEEKEKVQTGLKCNQSTTAKEADAKKGRIISMHPPMLKVSIAEKVIKRLI